MLVETQVMDNGTKSPGEDVVDICQGHNVLEVWGQGKAGRGMRV